MLFAYGIKFWRILENIVITIQRTGVLFKNKHWYTDPSAPYYEGVHVKTTKGEDEVVAASVWD